MRNIHFTSVLKSTYRQELEGLLFFNERQSSHEEAVMCVAECYGAPRIDGANGHLRVGLRSDLEVQTLFALDTDSNDQLAGAVVFTRQDNLLVVLYLAVREDYSCGEIPHRLLFRIIDELRSIARRVKGVSSVRVIRSAQRFVSIPAC